MLEDEDMKKAAEAKIDSIVNYLLLPAKERTIVRGPDAWNDGWSDEAYRRSSRATITNGRDTIKITPEAVRSLEQAVAELSRRRDVSPYWDDRELWSLSARLIASLPLGADDETLRLHIKRRLVGIVSHEPSLVAFPLANVMWRAEPMILADSVIGAIGPDWLSAVSAEAKGKPTIEPQTALWWLEPATKSGSDEQLDRIVGIATWIPAQGRKAWDAAITRFETILSLALVLEPHPELLNLWSGRGESHRPGVRGLTLDRQAISYRPNRDTDELLREFQAEPYQVGPFGVSKGVLWFGEDPFPLDVLLEVRKEAIEELVIGSSSIHGRFQTAARWYAKSHWSSSREDAVLYLGIALDALLGEKGGSPGRVLADRFALLEQKPGERANRAKLFNDLYSVRSSVAHGARAKQLNEPDFTRLMAASVRWVVQELLTRVKANSARSEEDHRKIFDDLKWGMASS